MKLETILQLTPKDPDKQWSIIEFVRNPIMINDQRQAYSMRARTRSNYENWVILEQWKRRNRSMKGGNQVILSTLLRSLLILCYLIESEPPKKKIGLYEQRKNMLNKEALKQLERREKQAAERRNEDEEYLQLLKQEYGQLAADVLREDYANHRKKKKKKGKNEDEEPWDATEKELIRVLDKNCPKGTRKK